MAYVDERGGRFTVRWSFQGTKHRSKPLNSRKAAERLKREIEDCLASGRSWPPGGHRTAPSMVEACNAWIEDQFRLQRAAGTLRRLALHLNLWNFWLKETVHRPTAEIGLEHFGHDRVAAFQAWLLSGRKVAPRTAAIYAQIVVRVWEWAGRTDRFGPSTPAFRPPVIEVPPPMRRPYAPTWAQMDAGIEAARDMPNRWVWRIMLIMRCTGLRAGQVRRLRGADLDLRDALLTVRPELGKSRSERRGRVIPAAPALVDEVATWNVAPGDLLVPGAPIALSDATVRRAWERAGVPEIARAQPLHCFRHGFIAGLAAAGVPEEIREILVGHSGGVNRDTYTPDVAFLTAMRTAVALVPPLGQHRTQDGPTA